MKRKLLVILMAALAAALLAIPAQAGQVNVFLDGWTQGYQVRYSLNTGGPSAATVGDSWTGEMRVRALDLSGGLVTQGFAYCQDLLQRVYWGENPGYFTAPPSSVVPGGLETVWLMEQYSPGMGASYTDLRNQVTALQIAIWEVVYDTWSNTNPYDLSSGAFSVSSILNVTGDQSTAILGLANSFLTALGDAKSNGVYDSQALAAQNRYTALVSEARQDLMLGNPSVPKTPEPGSMLLMGSALVGLAAWRRRRKK